MTVHRLIIIAPNNRFPRLSEMPRIPRDTAGQPEPRSMPDRLARHHHQVTIQLGSIADA